MKDTLYICSRILACQEVLSDFKAWRKNGANNAGIWKFISAFGTGRSARVELDTWSKLSQRLQKILLNSYSPS